jgi:hypothetical protein
LGSIARFLWFKTPHPVNRRNREQQRQQSEANYDCGHCLMMRLRGYVALFTIARFSKQFDK